jgi:hypothetical protein
MMMDSTEDPEAEFLKRAQELAQARVDAIKPLAPLISRRAELRRALAMTDAPYAELYRTALKAGWSAQELMEMGAEEPERTPRGRSVGRGRSPRKTRAKRTPAGGGEPASATAQPIPPDTAGQNAPTTAADPVS